MATVIVSDLHLGAPNSQKRLFLDFLDTEPDLLIINGDLVDSLDLRRFDENDWEIVSRLQELARLERLLIIRGNHDYVQHAPASLVVVPHLFNTRVELSKNLLIGNKSYLVIHGDKFDRTLDWRRTGQIADWIYYQIQRCGTSGIWLKHAAKRISGVVHQVSSRAISYAIHNGYDGIICGHTHFAADERINGIHYLNSGSWTEPVCHYLEIRDDKISLCHWPR